MTQINHGNKAKQDCTVEQSYMDLMVKLFSDESTQLTKLHASLHLICLWFSVAVFTRMNTLYYQQLLLGGQTRKKRPGICMN